MLLQLSWQSNRFVTCRSQVQFLSVAPMTFLFELIEQKKVIKDNINKKMRLNMALAREIGQFINDNKYYLEAFDKVEL